MDAPEGPVRRRPLPEDDITQPPTWTSSRPRGRSAFHLQEATRSARLNAGVAATITLFMLGWTLFRGVLPSLDPTAGIPLLVIQIGAGLTGWLAWSAADLADSLLAQSLEHGDPPASPPHRRYRVIAALAVLINAALMLAAFVR